MKLKSVYSDILDILHSTYAVEWVDGNLPDLNNNNLVENKNNLRNKNNRFQLMFPGFEAIDESELGC